MYGATHCAGGVGHTLMRYYSDCPLGRIFEDEARAREFFTRDTSLGTSTAACLRRGSIPRGRVMMKSSFNRGNLLGSWQTNDFNTPVVFLTLDYDIIRYFDEERNLISGLAQRSL